jgi:two-component system phosphate regulon sensor histidine kinase PhoR
MAFGKTHLGAALRALRAELDGGARAELPEEVRELANLLSEREEKRWMAQRDPAEQELLAAIPDAAALIARDGTVRVCNTAFDAFSPTGRSTGFTPLELVRSAELAEAVKRALEGSARRLELELPRRIWLVQVQPLLRGEVLLLMRDVTDRRRAEATRRDFVANASHELRTPIAAINASAETLLGGALASPETARPFVEIIARHTERLARLSNDLLDLSRIESRQWPIELGVVEVGPLAQQVVDLFAEAARSKGLALRSEVAAGLRVRADAQALEQILVNLVDNGIKYTQRGGVTVIGATDGAYGTLAVRDTGVGIERHHLPRIFERFYRVDPGRSREMGGTGLGLAIVKHLAQAQGGEVTVESGAEGTTFTVRLPLPG